MDVQRDLGTCAPPLPLLVFLACSRWLCVVKDKSVDIFHYKWTCVKCKEVYSKMRQNFCKIELLKYGNGRMNSCKWFYFISVFIKAKVDKFFLWLCLKLKQSLAIGLVLETNIFVMLPFVPAPNWSANFDVPMETTHGTNLDSVGSDVWSTEEPMPAKETGWASFSDFTVR